MRRPRNSLGPQHGGRGIRRAVGERASLRREGRGRVPLRPETRLTGLALPSFSLRKTVTHISLKTSSRPIDLRKAGRAITRRYKLIVPLWIIALVLATPLLLRASSVVSLQQGSTSNLGLEAQIAQNLVNTKFGSSSPSGSTLVVVISSDNATTTTKVHDYVIALSE